MSSLQRNLLWIAGLLCFGAVAYYFADIVSYLLIAWVLSMLGKPLMIFFLKRVRIRKFRIGTNGAAMLTILTFFLIVLGVIMMFVPTLVEQARVLTTVDYQAVGEKWRGPFAWLDTELHQLGMLGPQESLADRTQSVLLQTFRPALVGNFVGSFLATAGNVVAAIFSITFILFFFLKENRLFIDILHAFVPDEYEPKVRHAVEESSEVLTRYFRGLLTQVVSFVLICTILLWIMGVNNALLIGAFGGLLNVVPYVGPILGALFGIFITVSSHLDYEVAAMMPLIGKVAGAFLLTQFIDNNFVGPLIFSKSIKAHPLEIFIVTLASAKIGGVVGMVIGIPVYTVLRVIARTFFSEFKLVQRLTDHMETDEKDA
ncbi:MAG: AI-2E family transporter [Saprospiraceae bacterium]